MELLQKGRGLDRGQYEQKHKRGRRKIKDKFKDVFKAEVEKISYLYLYTREKPLLFLNINQMEK